MATKPTPQQSRPRTVRVRAAAGRVVTFPMGTIAGPGATSLRLAGDNAESEGASTGDLEVNNDAFVRRRIRSGDLIEVGATRASASASEHPNMSAARPSPLTTTSNRGKE